FRKNTTSDADMASLEGLIKDLGADRFRVREKATARLIAIGERAVPLLRDAEKSRDPEVAYRARRCLEQINTGAAEGLLATAARKPDGAAKVLLDYAPFAEQESLAEEVRTALSAVAVRDGKPDPVVVAALADRHPARRAAAGVALARAGAIRKVPALLKLLQD